MKNQGFSREVRAWSQSPSCTKGMKLLFYLQANNNVSTNEYRLIQQTDPGIQSPQNALILTSGVVGSGPFAFFSVHFFFMTIFLCLYFPSRVDLLHTLHDGDS